MGIEMNIIEMRRVSAKELCEAKGLVVEAFGAGVHVHGHGIDILIAKLEDLTATDLIPIYAPVAKVGLIARAQRQQ